MKIFWTNKQFNKFKDKLSKKSHHSGFNQGKEQGIKLGIAIIRKKFNLIRKEKT